MLALVEPGRPAALPRSRLDAPLRPLIKAASCGAPLDSAMRSVVGGFGFACFTYGRLAEPRLHPDARSLLWTTSSREWVDLYDRKSYIEVDPRLTESGQRATPVLWDGAALRRVGALRGFLADAARFGIRSGVSVSFRAPDHSRVVVALDSPVSPVDPGRQARIARRMGDIVLLALRFHDVFMAPVTREPFAAAACGAPLTARERECLCMAAHGLTSAQIGRKLDVAPRTVDFHFRNVVTKLGVLNRHEAIARGIATGLIGIGV
jgi:DNA-binding CsgD family transcriptional regulator